MQNKILEGTKNSFPETPEQLQNLSACTASDRSQQMSRAPIHSSTAAAPPSCAAICGCSQLRPRQRSPRSGRGALAEWPMPSQTYGTRWAQNNATLSLTGRRSLARRPETHPYIYIYLFIYLFIFIYLFVYLFIYLNIYIYICCIYAYLATVHLHTLYKCKLSHELVHPHTRIYIYIYIYIYIHIYIYIYI